VLKPFTDTRRELERLRKMTVLRPARAEFPIMNDHPSNERRTDPRRINSPTAWIVCSLVLLALIGTLFLYSGGSSYVPADLAKPNVVTGSNGSR